MYKSVLDYFEGNGTAGSSKNGSSVIRRKNVHLPDYRKRHKNLVVILSSWQVL